MTIVWLHTSQTRQYPYCVLRRAIVGGRISTLCSDTRDYSKAVSYGPVLITTEYPTGLACPQCEIELARGTPGAAHAVDPADFESDTKTPTRDLRSRTISASDIGIEWER